jgi:arylsulfatase A-like enzyme
MFRQTFKERAYSQSVFGRYLFLFNTGAAWATGIALLSAAATTQVRAAQTAPRPLSGYNILLITTDEERLPQYWPKGWVEKHLPQRDRLAQQGLTFRNAFCASAMCSPSRASLYTGLYPDQHKVKVTLKTSDPTQCTLQTTTQNMARLLASAGYDVQYRGKWHMSKDPSGRLDVTSPADLARYGFNGWVPPESGQDQESYNFGGGCANYDAQYADQAAVFLKSVDPQSPTPFALVVSFSNPHDIMGFPTNWNEKSVSDLPEFMDCDNYGSAAPQCLQQQIKLPPTVYENLSNNFKPHIQVASKQLFDSQLGPLPTQQDLLNYANFYAYLHKVVDKHIGTVLDALESNVGLRERTIIIRLADHGEMGLSHGGLREKVWNAYEETIHVPLVIANPVLFPKPVQTSALVSLIDVMPTLASLVGVPHRENYTFKGRDLLPIIRDAIENPTAPSVKVQDSILFATDETSDVITNLAMHIRCIRTADRKFSMYFDPNGVARTEYELYDLKSDPTEYYNLANPDPLNPYYDPQQTAEMFAELYRKMQETGTMPPPEVRF